MRSATRIACMLKANEMQDNSLYERSEVVITNLPSPRGTDFSGAFYIQLIVA